jgi:outer membrane lipase/esterase
MPINQLVVFGDSLADTGNNAHLIDAGVFGTPPAPIGSRTQTPIPDPTFIPTFPYSTNRYTNGPNWVDQFAADLGKSSTNSLDGGTNFAFGGARAGPGGPVPGLLDQLNMFFLTTGHTAPANDLYVIEIGGNDAHDALNAVLGGNDPSSIVAAYVANTLSAIGQLEGAGARDILLANVPDIGQIPAVRAFGPTLQGIASGIAGGMNAALLTMLATMPPQPGVDLHYLDLYGLLDALAQNPDGFDMTTACAAVQACIDNPAGTFFWDGIHATTAGATLIADAALAAIPEPSTVLLLFAVAVALWVTTWDKVRL